MRWFLTAGFSCAAAVVLLITAYRSLLPEVPAAESAGESTVLPAAESAGESTVLPAAGTAGESTVLPAAGTAGESTVLPAAESAGESTVLPTAGTAAETDPDETMRVALTFDDGPHSTWTVKLLDGLAERDVRATFFVIGENIPGNEDLIARMDQEGHLIGNHTYDHVKITDLSVEEACEQVERTSALVKAITGKDTEYVRPPFGSWRGDLECSFEMFPVLWDVDPLDWTTKNTSDVVRRVLEAVEPDDIILLHDCYESSVDAALQIADALLEQGYQFVTVDELILE